MKNTQKFENFLESLKGNGHDTLIESVKHGFRALNEGTQEDAEKKQIDSIANAIIRNILRDPQGVITQLKSYKAKHPDKHAKIMAAMKVINPEQALRVETLAVGD